MNHTKFSLTEIYQHNLKRQQEAQAAAERAEAQKREDFFLDLVKEFQHGGNPFRQFLRDLPPLQARDYKLQYLPIPLFNNDKRVIFELDEVPILVEVEWGISYTSIKRLVVMLDPRLSNLDWPTQTPFEYCELHDLRHLARLKAEEKGRIVHPADIIFDTRDDDTFYYALRGQEDNMQTLMSQLANTDLDTDDQVEARKLDAQDLIEAAYQKLCQSDVNGVPLPLHISTQVLCNKLITPEEALKEAYQLLRAQAEHEVKPQAQA